jgi:DnaJ-class molecular chaperone
MDCYNLISSTGRWAMPEGEKKQRQCETCNGEGTVGSMTCPRCEGEGGHLSYAEVQARFAKRFNDLEEAIKRLRGKNHLRLVRSTDK